MNIELLEKYCKNKFTTEELTSILEWLELSSTSLEGEELFFKLWEDLPNEDACLNIDFDGLLDKIHHKVNLDQSKMLLEQADEDLIKYKRRNYFSHLLLRAAAILLIPILTFGLYMTYKYQMTQQDRVSMSQTYNEIFSPIDAISKVTLSDGTNVWLNHGSSLKYPVIFNPDLRAVELLGEGYFEVANNPNVPFVVKVGAIQVMALGTTFNILAYPNEDKIETSLISGCVQLQRVASNGKVIALLIMKPNDLAVFNKSKGRIATRSVYDNRYFAWREGKLIFINEPLEEMVKKLSRWYNVEIHINDPMLNNLTYTATFTNETLSQVLELLTMVSPIKYSISNREEISPGTYSKRIVFLSSRLK
jgi:ferric-dicitrate binding protein FerR (iron transport regulator)